MKRLCFLLMLPVVMYLSPGCKARLMDAKGIADSLNKSKETTATGGIGVNLNDAKFATDAAVEGMYAVGMAKLALAKTKNPAVKKFAGGVAADYGKRNTELMRISKAKNITLPYTLDSSHQDKMDALGKLSDDSFDVVYIARMISDQKETDRIMQNESRSGTDSDLRAFAIKTGDVAKARLAAAHKVHDNLYGNKQQSM